MFPPVTAKMQRLRALLIVIFLLMYTFLFICPLFRLLKKSAGFSAVASVLHFEKNSRVLRKKFFL